MNVVFRLHAPARSAPPRRTLPPPPPTVAAPTRAQPRTPIPARAPRKCALLVGINYTGTGSQLDGCVGDAERMELFLRQRGFTHTHMLVERPGAPVQAQPTKRNILTAFTQLIATAQPGDELFFHYSGHGYYAPDRSGDESDGRDELIVAYDHQGILDDEFRAVLTQYMQDGVKLTAVFDSCHSGSMLDLKYMYMDADAAADADGGLRTTVNDRVVPCRGQVVMLSGCRDSQTSTEVWVDRMPTGALTWSFLQCMTEPDARPEAARASWRNLLTRIRSMLSSEFYSQTPQLSSNQPINLADTAPL